MPSPTDERRHGVKDFPIDRKRLRRQGSLGVRTTGIDVARYATPIAVGVYLLPRWRMGVGVIRNRPERAVKNLRLEIRLSTLGQMDVSFNQGTG
jgi:hypothetical protein